MSHDTPSSSSSSSSASWIFFHSHLYLFFFSRYTRCKKSITPSLLLTLWLTITAASFPSPATNLPLHSCLLLSDTNCPEQHGKISHRVSITLFLLLPNPLVHYLHPFFSHSDPLTFCLSCFTYSTIHRRNSCPSHCLQLHDSDGWEEGGTVSVSHLSRSLS